MKVYWILVKNTFFISFDRPLNLRGSDKTNRMKKFLYSYFNLDNRFPIIFVPIQTINQIASKYRKQLSSGDIPEEKIREITSFYKWKIAEILNE